MIRSDYSSAGALLTFLIAFASGMLAQDVAGFIEICKESVSKPAAAGLFTFKVTGVQKTFMAPEAACTGPIRVSAGMATVEEFERAGTALADVTTLPAGRLFHFDLKFRRATVRVPAGDVSEQTVLILTSRSTRFEPEQAPPSALSLLQEPHVPFVPAAVTERLWRWTFPRNFEFDPIARSSTPLKSYSPSAPASWPKAVR